MPLTGEAAERAAPRREGTYRRADRGFTAAFELVMTPALFGFIGYLLDGWLSTGRIFTIALPVLVAAYVVWKLWYSYNAEMKELEAEWLERRPRPSLRTERQ